MLRKVVPVLLVLVMLSSAVMPAMAAGDEEVWVWGVRNNLEESG